MYTIYSKPGCTYCEQAKTLLNAKGLAYDEFIIDVEQIKLADKKYVSVNQLKQVVPSAKTVPQILLDGTLVGGFESLKKSLT